MNVLRIFGFILPPGCTGGLAPTGEIYAEFFTETFRSQIALPMNLTKQVRTEKSREAFEKTILRQFEIGIIMNIQTASDLEVVA